MSYNKTFLLLDKIKWFGFRKAFWIIHDFFINSKEKFIDWGIVFPEYGNSLIKRNISRLLIEKYSADDGQNVDFTQYFLGFGLIHYTFVRNIKPDNILCIGSRKGFVPAVIALACKDNGKGHVDFVDAGYDRDEPSKHWSGIGFWKKVDIDNHFKKIGVNQYITTHIMTTLEYASKFPKKRYQYIYIDGDHSYKGVKLDFKLFWSKLDKHGYMSLHDVVARGYLDKGLFGVWKFWKEVGNKHSIVFPLPKDSGLGMLQK